MPSLLNAAAVPIMCITSLCISSVNLPLLPRRSPPPCPACSRPPPSPSRGQSSSSRVGGGGVRVGGDEVRAGGVHVERLETGWGGVGAGGVGTCGCGWGGYVWVRVVWCGCGWGEVHAGRVLGFTWNAWKPGGVGVNWVHRGSQRRMERAWRYKGA